MYLKGLKKHFVIIFCLFIIFSIYLSTVPASVFHGDSGETITASYTLGIQHPPGYPIFSLLGKIATLFPVGDISFRVYLLSVMLSLLCFISLIYFTSRFSVAINIKNPSLFFLISPSLIFATGFYIWEQSIIAKGGLYILNILFTILLATIVLNIYLANEKETKIKLFLLFFYLYGLSFGNHHMSQIALFPAYAFMFYKSGMIKIINIKTISILTLLFLIGFSSYLYLPFRAGTALLNWGEPNTLERFIQVFSRHQYLMGEGTRSFGSSFSQAGKYFSSLFYNFFYIPVLFSFIGIYLIYKRDKTIAIFMTSIPIIFLLAVSLYLNLSKERLYVMETYITPIYFIFSILSTTGIYLLTKNRKILFPLIVLVAITINLFMFYPKLDKSKYFFAYDFNRNILSSVETNSIIFITGDGVVFPCWYLKYVKNFRPDVTIIGSAVLPMEWVRKDVRRQNPAIRLPNITTKKIGKESTGRIIDAIIRMNIARFPIYFAYTKPEENAIHESIGIMPKGIVQKVVPKEHLFVNDKFIISNQALWKYYNFRNTFGTYPGFIDLKTSQLYLKDYSIIANTTGMFFEEMAFHQKSLDYYTLAHNISLKDHEYYYNMGNANFNLKKYDEALKMYQKCININNLYTNSWFNIGVTYYTIKEYKKSLDAFNQVKKIEPARDNIDSYISMVKKLVPQ